MVGFAILLLVSACMPALEQEDASKRITLDDFSFTLNSALATNVNVVQFPGDPTEEVYPGGPQPPHTQFVLYTELPVPEVMLQSRATITIYPLAEMDSYEAHTQVVETLRDLLTERPDLGEFEQTRDSLSQITLPFLPIMPGAQVIRARAEYVQTDKVNGIAYVTVYRQDAAPFLDYEFLYTFQGLSTDETKYISTVMPVRAKMFPDELPSDYDFETFFPRMTSYFAESIDLLNAGESDDFEPTLPLGVALVESITTSN
jgi:hypothetical protein